MSDEMWNLRSSLRDLLSTQSSLPKDWRLSFLQRLLGGGTSLLLAAAPPTAPALWRLWWWCQALVSFGSDFVAVGRTCAIHPLDRCMAAVSCLLVLCMRPGPYAFAAFFAWYLGRRSRSRETPRLYAWLHGLWHVLGALAAHI